MTQNTPSTRRRFLKGGALLAAPIAAAAVPVVALSGDEMNARVRRLEDESAIRDLHQSWLRKINAGEHDALLEGAALGTSGSHASPPEIIRRIIADHAGAPDRIEIAADGRSAVGHFDCAVEVETPLVGDCTLAQMAHLQGNGTLRLGARRALTVDYRKRGGTWTLGKVALAER
jgi:hypothetical protein